ncbi:radical SAM protein [Microbispora fusca]|uniref:Radical SAM protein n=1 Tax=Microbispora triticiradicis TaxID=2200763 RepID=A0A5R8ZEN6_9ACTN|nr:radical SAM protein [Microbispora fusca]
MNGVLARHLPTRAVVTGTLERRLLVVENALRPNWTLADLSGRVHASRSWPAWTAGHIELVSPSSWLSNAELTASAFGRLVRPRVLLVALYHPEYFPLPRFPLAISDIARAARATLMGHVELMDMQLGTSLVDILNRVDELQPDIVGVSATFGQHDLMLALLEALNGWPTPPLMLAGGSLTVRNERLLLERYPELLIARGAGEPTIQDVLAYWHGDLRLEQVRGIGYQGSIQRGPGTVAIGRARRTPTVANRQQTDIWPELDLLERTFAHGGVAQLETSRGCTSSCSFCPRGHKGHWAGAAPEGLEWLLSEISAVFDRHPHVSRTLYLVDEEFIGRGAGAGDRALSIARTLRRHNFAWETSCRVDQVVWPGKDRAWHLERARLWRSLVDGGLRRCLFGVESGVTSVLERFHKETTGEQNALTIRTLSALGVPTRFTYITFDHLMSAQELHATHAFQARTDLVLEPLPHLSVEQIVDGVRDEDFVAAHSRGVPFFTEISYMLVSMECLVGAAYTRKVIDAGLAGQVRPSMGRIDAEFADRRIGVLSRWAQRWVDRNFALDYTLKSLEKVLDNESRHAVRAARQVLKQAAFDLFTTMLALLDDTPLHDSGELERLNGRCRAHADVLLGKLRSRVSQTVTQVAGTLPPQRAEVLLREHGRWADDEGRWQLINASDPCGT